MGVVASVASGQIRRRWRGTVVLILLVGIVGALVLATVGGARRTHSALARFNRVSRSSSIQVFTTPPTRSQLRAFEHVPRVVGAAAVNALYIAFPRAPNLNAAVPEDGALGTVVDRARVLAGRKANPRAVDEIAIDESLSKQVHLRVGDHLDAVSYTPAQSAALIGGATDAGPPAGPMLRFRVVGIVRRPLDLGRTAAPSGALPLTPAFGRKYSGRIGSFGTAVLVRARGGSPNVRDIKAAARRIFGPSPQFSVASLADQNEGAQSAIDVLTGALWILAAVAALAGVVAVAIILSREIALASVDQPALHALGFTRRQRVAANLAPTFLIAIGGGVVAALGAIVASPLFPIGVARQAEPNLGFHVDWLVVVSGVFAVTGVVLVIGAVEAVRASRRAPLAMTEPAGHRSALVDAAARSGAAPTMTNGLRMALQPGRGRTAVPVRSALGGAMFGVFGVTAAVVLAASLSHLVATPSLYGWTFDVRATDTVSNEKSCTRDTFGLLRIPGLGAVAAACYGSANVTLDGRGTNGWAFVPVRGQVEPEAVRGRDPTGRDEVALGSATLRALGKHIGDRIRAAGPYGSGEYRIVGQVVLPTLGQAQPLDDGAAFTADGFKPLFDQNNFYRYLLGRFTPGADQIAVRRKIATISQLSDVHTSAPPVEIDRLRQVDWFPATLAGFLSLLALVAVGHALVTAVRRRRRDLAILKTLGFDRTQVRRTVAWQATTIGTIGIAVGLPAGIVTGGVVWHRIASDLGVSTAPSVPTLEVLLLVPAVILLVNLVAFLPALAAARARPSTAFRAE